MLANPETVLKLAAIAVGGIAILVAAGDLRDAIGSLQYEADGAVIRSSQRQALARCRTLTPQHFKTDRVCREVWTENRRRFFALSTEDQVPE
ncbi:MAG: putative entry exclusion protein TrbK-alt [Pseudomonadota bacterium]